MSPVVPLPALSRVHRQLAELAESALFVGSTTWPLLWPESPAPASAGASAIRLTWDVSTDFGYAALLGRLDELGVRRPHARAPWNERRLDDITIVIEPPVPTLLGFSSQWHRSALARPALSETESGSLRCADRAHYLALRLEELHRCDLGTPEGTPRQPEGEALWRELVTCLSLDGAWNDELGRAPSQLQDFVASELARLAGEPDFATQLRRELSPGAALNPAWARANTLVRHWSERAAALTAPSPEPPAVSDEAPEVSLRGPEVWRPRSGAIRAVAYDPRNQWLTVEFGRGAVYTYLDVPPLVFGAWKNAVSPGLYHGDYVRDRYDFRRVR
ncbi:MAG TPA: KTSC domain-containing protein [Polyangiaceae bacterium]|nr:KTSC domain-containing protein [Polyangiaceae bacterium]